MQAPIQSVLLTGFLLGWSVAWPPGPINAEIARRCLARGFWAGFSLLLGACSGDALWAVVVSLGMGVVLTGTTIRFVMGITSIVLLLALAGVFFKGAWTSLRAKDPAAAEAAPARFDSRRAGFLLGAGMALTSPWNVAFWLAAIGRPEMARYGLGSLLLMAAAVLAGALIWGILWSAFVTLVRRSGGGRLWDIAVKGLTGLLMLYFAVASWIDLVSAS
ncbi:MAG: LysE family transporter [Ancalomicrobiaceae bacterium]|nr:LysE family transporter [Ancalomicrobiaceae bacterium]